MLRCKLVPEIHCGSLSLTPTVLFSLVTKSLEFGSLQFTSYDSVNLFMKLAFSSLLRESAFTSVWVISCHPCLSEAPAPGEHPGSLWADKGPIPIQNLQNRPKEHPKICIFYKCWDGADAAQVASRWKALEEPLTCSFEPACANASCVYATIFGESSALFCHLCAQGEMEAVIQEQGGHHGRITLTAMGILLEGMAARRLESFHY